VRVFVLGLKLPKNKRAEEPRTDVVQSTKKKKIPQQTRRPTARGMSFRGFPGCGGAIFNDLSKH
jgi:hypothetical protein